MYIYAVLLAIGFFGIVGMACAGFIHIGPHVHGGHHGHGPLLRGGHGAHHTGHHGGHHSGHAHGHGARFDLKSLFSFSPLDLFSYCAGAGMGAFLARPYVQKSFLPWFAIAGALLFDLCFTRTIANLIGKFGAEPSTGLEGTVAKSGEAVTNFDADGRGLIRLTLDGQIVQLLATLDRQELDAGVRVRRGESVFIVEVDSQRNRCLVSREFADAPLEIRT